MGHIGKIRVVIDAVDLDELGEAVTEAGSSGDVVPAVTAAAPESVPA